MLYSLQEPRTTNNNERFCLERFNKVVRVSMREEDFNRIVRLGRADSVQLGKSIPFLMQFRDRILKNMVMDSLSKLKVEAADEMCT